MVINEEYIVQLLNTRQKAVERAMMVIYDRQTQDEKVSQDTKHHNNVGFSGADARLGTYYARWVLGGRHLTDRHLARARKMAIKYRKQLLDEAHKKATRGANS